MHQRLHARVGIVFGLLALAEPTPTAQNASTEDLAVSISVAASCYVSRQSEDASGTSKAADLVTLRCANGATGADPLVSVSEPTESTPASGESTQRVVTINF